MRKNWEEQEIIKKLLIKIIIINLNLFKNKVLSSNNNKLRHKIKIMKKIINNKKNKI